MNPPFPSGILTVLCLAFSNRTRPLSPDWLTLTSSPFVPLSAGHLDRSPDGFFHLGDLSLRGSYNGAEAECASVGAGAVAAAAEEGVGGLGVGSVGVNGSRLLAGGLLRVPSGGDMLWHHSRRVPMIKGRGKTGNGVCPLAQGPATALSPGGSGGSVATGPLTVTRHLLAESADAGGALVLRLCLSNSGSSPVKISSLGLAMPFDQDFVGRTLPQERPE